MRRSAGRQSTMRQLTAKGMALPPRLLLVVFMEARFAGVIHHVRFPVTAVLGIYARKTGEGMVFSEQDLGPEPPRHLPQTEEGGPRRPQLKVVK